MALRHCDMMYYDADQAIVAPTLACPVRAVIRPSATGTPDIMGAYERSGPRQTRDDEARPNAIPPPAIACGRVGGRPPMMIAIHAGLVTDPAVGDPAANPPRAVEPVVAGLGAGARASPAPGTRPERHRHRDPVARTPARCAEKYSGTIRHVRAARKPAHIEGQRNQDHQATPLDDAPLERVDRGHGSPSPADRPLGGAVNLSESCF